MMYFATPSTPSVREAMTAQTIGAIFTPAQGNRMPDQAMWCADNGCFGKGYPGDGAYLEWLEKQQPYAARCVFATAPDVVGDAAATLARSAPLLPQIRQLGYPAALVAQDGLEHLQVPWDTFDVLFLGGTTAWKLSPAAAALARQAKGRSKWVHMGRVNSLLRLRYAAGIGCDSADGTHITYRPDVYLPEIHGWLTHLGRHGAQEVLI